MKANTISTLASSEIMRASMARRQSQLNDTLTEFSSGRHADVGVTLGTQIGSALDMRHIISDLTSLNSTNGVVGARLDNIQSSIGGVRQLATGLIEMAIALRQNSAQPELLAEDAKSRLGSVFDMLTVTSNGSYVFSGTNTSERPIDNYLSDPPGPARSAVIAAFTTTFGFPPDDPQAATISAVDYQAYLDGPFAALFEEPSWSLNFSDATDGVMRDRISPNEEINSSSTVNDPGIRKLYYALALSIDGGVQHLSGGARDLLSDRVVEKANEATYELVRQQSVVGMAQERLTQANERNSIETQALQSRVGAMEEVDAYEVADRLGMMMTQLEASYSVTSRLQKLSLLNYL